VYRVPADDSPEQPSAYPSSPLAMRSFCMQHQVTSRLPTLPLELVRLTGVGAHDPDERQGVPRHGIRPRQRVLWIMIEKDEEIRQELEDLEEVLCTYG
jgi:hypothetical protein